MGLTTYIAFKRAKQLAVAQLALAVTKEEKLSADIRDQGERTAKAEANSEQLKKDNLILQRQILTLRSRMADRTVRPEQKEKMLAVLKTRPPSQVVVQSLLSEGREALQYAMEIADVFRAASWKVTDPNGLGSFAHPIAGTFLVVSPDMNSNGSADFVTQVLIAGDITSRPIKTSIESRRGNGVLEIWVAAK